MASKKVTIPIKDLPAPTADNTYLVRYRIISDDRNRISQWSPIYTIPVPYITKAISGITGSGTKVTFTTVTPHGFVVGDIVSISGTDPVEYSYTSVAITEVGSTTQFSVAKTDTTTWVSGGRVNAGKQILKSVVVASNTATVTWSLPDTITNTSFDVYAKTQTGDPAVWGSFVHKATVSSNSFSMIADDEDLKVQFLVQAVTDTKVESPGAVIFYSAEYAI
jgi:hypothetical protein